MVLSKWICSTNTKNMFVKIVHPGGHVELHDRPVMASEIVWRNPRCVVAYPHVFKQPSAIVSPETLLKPGQKFYVVPISTIRKLQRLSNRYSSPSPSQTPATNNNSLQGGGSGDDDSTSCCLFMSKTSFMSGRGEGSCSDNNCFQCMMNIGSKTKDKFEDVGGEETTSSSNLVISPDLNRGLIRKRVRRRPKGSPKGLPAAIDQWQPSLASINEMDE